MTKHHPRNERLKHANINRLREARGMSEASIDQVVKALDRFETYTRHRDFKLFHIDQAKGFKQHLAVQRNERTDAPLSKMTVYSTLTALKAFFMWLAEQPGYRSRISYTDTEYFNLNMKDTRVAKAVREPRVPTLEAVDRIKDGTILNFRYDPKSASLTEA
jgi:integrase/recombinase XerD